MPKKKNNPESNRNHNKTTRELLIDSARKLFARIGLEKTTMSDIAKDSQRGRRTVYLYFRSKREIFNAVVARELELLALRQKEVANAALSPHEKLMQLIVTHMETIYDIVMRNGTLKASFFQDIYRLELIRLKLDLSEQALIEQILIDGNRKGDFNLTDTRATAVMLQHAIKGFEVLFINACEGVGKPLDATRLYEASANLVLRGVGYQGIIKADKVRAYPHVEHNN